MIKRKGNGEINVGEIRKKMECTIKWMTLYFQLKMG